jgi:hypothetical protein
MNIERLSAPNYEEVEARLGARLPRSLKALYRDRQKLGLQRISFTDSHGEERWFERFIPIDGTMLEAVWLQLWNKEWPFADAGDEDYYFVKLSQQVGDDGPVYLFLHDGGDREHIADGVSSFVEAIESARR